MDTHLEAILLEDKLLLIQEFKMEAKLDIQQVEVILLVVKEEKLSPIQESKMEDTQQAKQV